MEDIEIKKEIIYQKGLVEITEKNFMGEKKSFKFKLSVETPDRSNDIVKVSGIKLNNYTANPVVLFNHDQSLLPIGEGKDLEVMGEVLMGEVEFHEETQLSKDIANLVEKGYMRAVSIGFLPLKVTSYPITEEMRQTGKYYPYTSVVRVIEEAELLEFSLVAIPANQEALITMSLEDQLEIKAGATLNKGNLEKLKQALALITEVIMSNEMPMDDNKSIEVEEKQVEEDVEIPQGHSIDEVFESGEVVKVFTTDLQTEILSKIKY